ncbi:MAG: hypothetical protein ACTSRW_00685 [Candidatus Helarchaeota archaeon]
MAKKDLKEAIRALNWVSLIMIAIAVPVTIWQAIISIPNIIYPVAAVVVTIIILILYAKRVFSKISSKKRLETGLAVEICIYAFILLIVFGIYTWFAGIFVGTTAGLICYVVAD